MSDPMTTITVATTALACLGITTFAALRGWQGWLDVRRLELNSGGVRAEGRSPAGDMIEVADLKERVRKLEAIAGLRRPSAGKIVVANHTLFSSTDRIDLPPRSRRIGYVPQDALLFPHLSVRGNVLFGANHSTNTRLGIEAIAEMLEIASLLDRRVSGLSGGERQRVALGRVAARPGASRRSASGGP